MVLASYILWLEQALVSDRCSNFQSPDKSLITHLPPIPLSLHSISSYLNFWIPSVILPFKITLSTYFWLQWLVRSLQCERESTFIGWSVKIHIIPLVTILLTFFMGRRCPHKAWPICHTSLGSEVKHINLSTQHKNFKWNFKKSGFCN